MKGFAVFGGIVLTILLVIGLMFGLSAVGLVHYQFFAPKFQAAEREVYEQTPSYVQGKEQSLSELRFEYNRAKTQGEKNNIRAMIVNEAATVDVNLLKDASLRRFVLDIREAR